MRKSIDIESLLENAVAEALGLERPHPDLPARTRMAHRRPVRRHRHGSVAAPPRHERPRVAAA